MKKMSGLLVCICIVALVWYWKDGRTPASAMHIGIIAPLSGQYGAVGNNVLSGAKLYQLEWNTKHPDSPLIFTVEDDAFDAKKGVAAYKKLTELDHVDAVLNVSSPTIDALYDQVAHEERPFLQLGEQSIPPAVDSIFQITPSQLPMLEALGARVASTHPKNTVILVSNIPAYLLFVESFKKGFASPADLEFMSNDATAAKTLSIKIIEKRYDEIVIIGTPDDGSRILKELLLYKNNSAQFHISTDMTFSAGITEYKKILGDTLYGLDGTTVLSPKSMSPQFVQDYKNLTGQEPGFWSDLGYEGIKVLVESHGSKSWVKSVQDIKTSGVTDEITFDKKGQRAPGFVFKTVEHGQLK